MLSEKMFLRLIFILIVIGFFGFLLPVSIDMWRYAVE